jgi:tetratricopeptide (TPR) repeat protein
MFDRLIVRRLLGRLTDPRWETRERTLRTLAPYASHCPFEAITSLLKDQHQEVRAAAAACLCHGAINKPGGIQMLNDCLASADYDVRRQVAGTLWETFYHLGRPQHLGAEAHGWLVDFINAFDLSNDFYRLSNWRTNVHGNKTWEPEVSVIEWAQRLASTGHPEGVHPLLLFRRASRYKLQTEGTTDSSLYYHEALSALRSFGEAWAACGAVLPPGWLAVTLGLCYTYHTEWGPKVINTHSEIPVPESILLDLDAEVLPDRSVFLVGIRSSTALEALIHPRGVVGQCEACGEAVWQDQTDCPVCIGGFSPKMAFRCVVCGVPLRRSRLRCTCCGQSDQTIVPWEQKRNRIRELRELSQSEELSADGRLELGKLLFATGEIPSAEDNLRQAVELNPDSAQARILLCLALMGFNQAVGNCLRKSDEATANIEWLMAKHPGLPEVRWLGQVLELERLQNLRDWPSAIECGRMATAQFPDNYIVHFMHSVSLAAFGERDPNGHKEDLAAALRHARLAVGLQPAFEPARKNMKTIEELLHLEPADTLPLPEEPDQFGILA